jgi:hypothetical protein
MDMQAVNPGDTFKQLRSRLPAEQQPLADEFDAALRTLEAHGAKAAATRLRRLNDYAEVLPPESLPDLLDTDATLDELEEAFTNAPRIHWFPWLQHSRLTLARNILALLPLFITWLSLFLATNAYQTETHLHPNLVYQPFLILWQNGFEQGWWLTFSFVAGVDAVLFVLIIGATIGIHDLERRAREEARRVVTQMDGALMQLVAVLGRSRAAFAGNPRDWASVVNQVIKEAMAETKKLALEGQRVTQSANAAVAAAATAAQAARESTQQTTAEMRDYIAQVRQEYQETVTQLHTEFKETVERFRHEDQSFFSQANNDTRTQIDTLITTMRDRIDVLFTQLRDAIGETSEVNRRFLKDVAGDLRTAIGDTNATNRQFLAEANAESVATIKRVAEETGRILQATQATVAQLQPSVALHQAASQEMAGAMTRVADATQTFNSSISSSMQTFVSAASAMDGHVQEVARAQERATQQSESMATALSAAAGETKTAATGLQGTTERMSEALSHAAAMSSEVSEANTQWRQTQVAFMQTQGTLHDVIKALQDTARRLNDIKINVTILGLRLPFVRGKATAESN